jgi:putative hydrolase of the HAD superfamily
MQGLKCVILDFDQTIINSPKGFDIASENMKDEYQRFFDKNGYDIAIGDHWSLLRKTMREIDAQKQYNRDLWWNLLLEKLNITDLKFTEEECKKLTKHYWDTTVQFTELYPDTLEILEYLKNKGYLLGLITDTDGLPGMKQIRLEKSGILEYFDGVVISGEDVPEIKPDPAPFLKLMSILGVSSTETVMVGDKPFTDITGGKAAELRTVLVLREDWEVEPVPDYQIKELSELKNIL